MRRRWRWTARALAGAAAWLSLIAIGQAEPARDRSDPTRALPLLRSPETPVEPGGEADTDLRWVLDDGRGFVRYLSGTLPIIVTTVHGGDLRPTDLADRVNPGPTDINTRELAEAIDAALLARTGQHPHRVVVDLHRDKLDANRDLEEATQGDPGAARAWRAFHRFVEGARRAVELRHGRGLLLDVHGLAASRPHHELGILLSGAQLEVSDDRLEHPVYALESSVRGLVMSSRLSLPELIRGPLSLGAHLSAAGFPAVPSPDHPDAARDPAGHRNPFFGGGYITRRHGSRRGGGIDAIQVESRAAVRDDPAQRQAFARAFVDGLQILFAEGYRRPLDVRARVTLVGPRQPAWAGATTRVRVERNPPFLGALGVEVLGLAAARSTVIPAGASGASVELSLRNISAGLHRIGLSAGSTVAVGDDLLLEVGDPAAPAIELALTPPRPSFGRPLRLRLIRARPGPARPARDVKVEGGRLEPAVTLGLTAGATVAQAIATLWPDGPAHVGGVRMTVGELAVRARVQGAYADPDLALWIDGTGSPLEDLAPTPHQVLELPDRIERIDAGPRAPALLLDGFEDRAWVDGPTYGDETGFTVALWFRADADRPSDGYRYAFSHGHLSDAPSLNVYLTSEGHLRTALRGDADPYAPAALDVGGPDLRDGRWHHYALTVEPGPTATVYLDGRPRRRATRGLPMGRPGTGLHLGGRHDLSPTRELDGGLDEIQIWRRALSPEEITRHASPDGEADQDDIGIAPERSRAR